MPTKINKTGPDDELLEFEVVVLKETPKAYYVKLVETRQAFWLARSTVQDYCEENGKITSIFIKRWLATDKGII